MSSATLTYALDGDSGGAQNYWLFPRLKGGPYEKKENVFLAMCQVEGQKTRESRIEGQILEVSCQV
jgi:hypothetical protein